MIPCYSSVYGCLCGPIDETKGLGHVLVWIVFSCVELDAGGKLKPLKAPKGKEKEYDEVKIHTNNETILLPF
jgi:hypothetical protein